MNFIKPLFLLLFSTILFSSCQSDDDFNPTLPAPEGDFTDGFYVVNEGPFGGTGSLSFIKNDFSETINNAFAQVNPNEDIGGFVQSVFFSDEHIFIISNGSNLINVVNRYTLEFVALIDSGFEVPRFGTVVNNKAYVTNLASFNSATDDFVAVINLETFEVEDTIAVNNTANRIVAYNNQLIVQNAAFSMGNSISLIDTQNQQVSNVLVVGEGFNSMAINNNKLLTLGSTQFTEINLIDFTISAQLPLPEAAVGAKNIQIDQEQVYYTNGNSVFTNTLTDLNFQEDSIFSYETTSESGVFYGFEVRNGQLFIADGGDFASNGNIYVYDNEGNLLFETETGLGPNGFFFNE